jgi:UDP-N-acetylenolpyruvoylglucosamine reductase
MSTVSELVDRGLIKRDVPLGPLTTYKTGGPARLFAVVDTQSDLDDLIASGLTEGSEILVLGRGSNLLVADGGFDGLVVRLGGDFLRVEVEDDVVGAGGAAPLSRVARTAVGSGLNGLEFFVGIPGSVGGAVRQNAGCFGVETADRLVEASIVDLVSGAKRRASPGDLDLSYRHSNLGAAELVAAASFRGRRGDPEEGRRLMREVTRWRKEHQPGGTLNAGSVFKNPPGMTAGELIDHLGLKGMRVGDVAVSDKHANFFVAGPKATAADIHRLVAEVKDTVFERSGTMLEPEIQFVGFDT